MHSHLLMINETLAKKKVYSPEAVWKVLCKQYSSISSSYLYPTGRDYLALVRSFNVKDEDPNKPVFTKNLNQYFKTNKLKQNGQFAVMLRVFLNCFPDFLPDLNENITEGLDARPYHLPIGIEISKITNDLRWNKVPAARLLGLYVDRLNEDQLLRVIDELSSWLDYNSMFERDNSKVAVVVLQQIFDKRPDLIIKVQDIALNLIQNPKPSKQGMHLLGLICERPEANLNKIISVLQTYSPIDERAKDLKFMAFGLLAQSGKIDADSMVKELTNKIKDFSQDHEPIREAAYYAIGRLKLRAFTTCVKPGSDLNVLMPVLEEQIIEPDSDAGVGTDTEIEMPFEDGADEDEVIRHKYSGLAARAVMQLSERGNLDSIPRLMVVLEKLFNNCHKQAQEIAKSLLTDLFAENQAKITHKIAKKVTGITSSLNFVMYALGYIGSKLHTDVNLVLPFLLDKLKNSLIPMNVAELNAHIHSQYFEIHHEQPPPFDLGELFKLLANHLFPDVSAGVINALDLILTSKPELDLSPVVPLLIEKLQSAKRNAAKNAKALLAKIDNKNKVKVSAEHLPDLIALLQDEGSIPAAVSILEAIAHMEEVEIPAAAIAEFLWNKFVDTESDHPALIIKGLGKIATRPDIDISKILPALLARLQPLTSNEEPFFYTRQREYLVIALGDIGQRKDVDPSQIIKTLFDMLDNQYELSFTKAAAIRSLVGIAQRKDVGLAEIVKILVANLSQNEWGDHEISDAAAEGLFQLSKTKKGESSLMMINALFEIFHHSRFNVDYYEKVTERIVSLATANDNLSEAQKNYLVHGVLFHKVNEFLKKPDANKNKNYLHLISIIEMICEKRATRYNLMNDTPKLNADVAGMVMSFN